MSTLMERLLDEFAVFDYATAVASRLDSTDIPDPVNYRMGAADWSGFQTHLEGRGFEYNTSMVVLEDLREVIGIEQYEKQ